MLVLSRRLRQSIMIGPNIVVTPIGIDQGKISIAIEAPREIPILREELLGAPKNQSRVGTKRPASSPASPNGGVSKLVLSRKINESIVISDDITVKVVEIRGDRVRLGIVAPKEVPIYREEIYKRIHGEPESNQAG